MDGEEETEGEASGAVNSEQNLCSSKQKESLLEQNTLVETEDSSLTSINNNTKLREETSSSSSSSSKESCQKQQTEVHVDNQQQNQCATTRSRARRLLQQKEEKRKKDEIVSDEQHPKKEFSNENSDTVSAPKLLPVPLRRSKRLLRAVQLSKNSSAEKPLFVQHDSDDVSNTKTLSKLDSGCNDSDQHQKSAINGFSPQETLSGTCEDNDKVHRAVEEAQKNLSKDSLSNIPKSSNNEDFENISQETISTHSPRPSLPSEDLSSSSSHFIEKDIDTENGHLDEHIVNNELQSETNIKQSQGNKSNYAKNNQLKKSTVADTYEKNPDDIHEGNYNDPTYSGKDFSPDSGALVPLRDNSEVNTNCEQSLISKQSNSPAMSQTGWPSSGSHENMVLNRLHGEPHPGNPYNIPQQISETRNGFNTKEMFKAKRLQSYYLENSFPHSSSSYMLQSSSSSSYNPQSSSSPYNPQPLSSYNHQLLSPYNIEPSPSYSHQPSSSYNSQSTSYNPQSSSYNHQPSSYNHQSLSSYHSQSSSYNSQSLSYNSQSSPSSLSYNSQSSSYNPPRPWPPIVTAMSHCDSIAPSDLSQRAPIDMSVDQSKLWSRSSNAMNLSQTNPMNNAINVRDMNGNVAMCEQMMKPVSNLPFYNDQNIQSRNYSESYKTQQTNSNAFLSGSSIITSDYNHLSTSVSSKDDTIQNILASAHNVINSDVLDYSLYKEQSNGNQHRASPKLKTRNAKFKSNWSPERNTQPSQSVRDLPLNNRMVIPRENTTQSSLNDPMFNNQLQLGAVDPLSYAINLTKSPASIPSTHSLQQSPDYMQHNKGKLPPNAHANISKAQFSSHLPSAYANVMTGGKNAVASLPKHRPATTLSPSNLTNKPAKSIRYLPHHLLQMPLCSDKSQNHHVCSASNIMTPQYTSSIYTCASSKATYTLSTPSTQSFNVFHPPPPPPPPYSNPPPYDAVVNNMAPTPIKKENFLSDQHFGSNRKLLWQRYSEGNSNTTQVKTEAISDLNSSNNATSRVSLPSFQDSFCSNSVNSQMSSNQSSFSHSANNYQTPHSSSINETFYNQQLPKSSVGKTKLAPTKSNDNNKRLKTFNHAIPSASNAQFRPDAVKIETDQNGNPSNPDVKYKFSINSSNFTESDFQKAFLNSCPANTKISKEKMSKISGAFNSTVRNILNNNHPAGSNKNSCHEGTQETPPQVKPEPQKDPLHSDTKNTDTKENKEDANNLFNRLKANIKIDIPACDCLGPGYVPNEAVEGPFYTHLGAGSSLEEVKKIMEERTGFTGEAVRVEKIIFTGKEGKSSQGCPIAKWILRRAGVEEKVLCIVRHRQGHFCETACLIVGVVAWEGIPNTLANEMYEYLVPTLTQFGVETDRRCGYNERKTCACQGVDSKQRGASFSFGCSWSMYFNGCKFARSKDAKKFRLKDRVLDAVAENKFQSLATRLGPLYKAVAPEAYNNQVFLEDSGYECRLGFREKDSKPSRPFTGVTACVDFCAHSHKDLHNMNNGCTVVLTLTKHGPLEKPKEEQLHVLPLYILDLKDKQFEEKLKKGSIEILSKFPKVARVRATPVLSKRKAKIMKDNSKVNPRKRKTTAVNSQNTSVMCQDSAKSKSYQCTTTFPQNDMANASGSNIVKLLQKSTMKNMLSSAPSSSQTTPSSFSLNNSSLCPSASSSLKVESTEGNNDNFSDQSVTNSDPSNPSTQPNNGNECNQFNNYLYAHDTFPPANFPNDAHSEATKLLTNQAASLSNVGITDPLFNQQPKHIDLRKRYEGLKKISADILSPTGSVCNVPFVNSGSSSTLTLDDFESPLHLLSEAVMIRSETPVEKSRNVSPQSHPGMSAPRKPVPNPDLVPGRGPSDQNSINISNHQFKESSSNANNMLLDLPKDQHSTLSPHGSNFDRKDIFDNVNTNLCQNNISNPDNLSSSMPSLNMPFSQSGESIANCSGSPEDKKSELISAELELNEQNFNDPDIGGVAIALTHGSVLFEVAKRELHATTALMNPNRFQPTRISLVFYQHKSMNLRHHGWYENERKIEVRSQQRLREEAASKNCPNEELKPAAKKRRKRGGVAPSPSSSSSLVNNPSDYKLILEAAIKHSLTKPTDSVVTQAIDPIC
ncbi:methylcytosine dioxygenase tet3-A-like, partial [Argonauta hians]